MTEPTVIWPNNENKRAFVLSAEYASPNFVCHMDSSVASEFVELAAGDSIEMLWTKWPPSHKGPILSYLANAGDDFANVDKENLQFVKIDEAGLIHNDTDKNNQPVGYYAADKLIDDGYKWPVQIPEYTAPGNYVLRHELIALMGAKNEGHAQHYPQCINIKVTRGGNDPITSGVRAKDLYQPTDPGIQINIYRDLNYQIPGPEIYQPDGAASAKTPLVKSVSNTAATPATIASTPVAKPLTTLISSVSSVPVRPSGNAIAFPSLVHPSPTRQPKPNTPSSGSYTYDFSGLQNGSEKEDATKDTTDKTNTGSADQGKDNGNDGGFAGQAKDANDAGSADQVTDNNEAGSTSQPTKYAGTASTGGANPSEYNAALDANGKSPKSAPVGDHELSSFSADGLEIPKHATVEQLIAFSDKLLNKIKSRVLGHQRRYARNFSMK